jgi:hypothetical protein
MKTIHYWFPERLAALNKPVVENASSAEAADSAAFKSVLSQKLTAKNKFDSALSTFDQLTQGLLPNEMFGNNPLGNLMNISVDGIQKVWAEQLKSPWPPFANLSKDKTGDSNMLGDVIALTVREHIVKARKQLARQVQRFGVNENLADNENSTLVIAKAKNGVDALRR